MDDQQREQDRFRLGGGEHRDASSLPPHLRKLHRRIQKAAREDRQAKLNPRSDDQARWPGLIEPNE
jgi:hypothetical protein